LQIANIDVAVSFSSHLNAAVKYRISIVACGVEHSDTKQTYLEVKKRELKFDMLQLRGYGNLILIYPT
jgi:hypothetical protein